MIDPSDPLQDAIVAAARALKPRIEVYDEPPARPIWPYVSLSGVILTDDGADPDCYAGCRAEVVLHICSQEPGTREARKVGRNLLSALDAALTVAGFRVVTQELVSAVYSADPDSRVRGTLRFSYDLQATPA